MTCKASCIPKWRPNLLPLTLVRFADEYTRVLCTRMTPLKWPPVPSSVLRRPSVLRYGLCYGLTVGSLTLMRLRRRMRVRLCSFTHSRRFSFSCYLYVLRCVFYYTLPAIKSGARGFSGTHWYVRVYMCVCDPERIKICDNSMSRFECLSRFGLESTCRASSICFKV